MPQSLAQVYLHVVFSTKNREPDVAEDWREELFDVIGSLAAGTGCPPLTVGGVADHIHLLVRLSRTVTVADLLGRVKSLSSQWVNETRHPLTPFRWQGGYSTFSVSHSKVEAVREYIRRQPEHHATRTFQDELREWFARQEMEYDERYAWD